MDAWKIRRTEQGGLTEKGHPSHSKGSQFLISSSLASHIGRSEPDRSFTGSTSSIDRWAAERVQAERDELVRERAAELAPRIVEAFGDAFAGDNSRDALKGLISVLANEILTFTGCVNEEVWHPVSLWIRLYNCANVQHPLQHAGGIISLLSRCKEHGLAAAFPDNWANGPMYWSADADEEFANRTSLATLRDRWISQLHDLQANGGYSWPWLAESFIFITSALAFVISIRSVVTPQAGKKSRSSGITATATATSSTLSSTEIGRCISSRRRSTSNVDQ